jgi:hypothetical protein
MVVPVMPLLLAAALTVAAVSKALNRMESREAALRFGVPPVLATLAATVLPPIELALAVGLVVPSARRLAGLLTFLMLSVFTVRIAVSLRRGERPPCACFGRFSRGSINAKTLFRNGALLALAGATALGHPFHVRVTSQSVLVFLALAFMAMVIAIGWLVVMISRQQASVLARLDALENQSGSRLPIRMEPPTSFVVGKQAPRVAATSANGGSVSLPSPGGRPECLLFLSVDCEPCHEILRHRLARWRAQYPHLEFVPIIIGELGAQPLPEGGVIIDPGRIMELQVAGTPAAVLVREDGIVMRSIAYGPPAIEELLMDTSSNGLYLLSAGSLAGGAEQAHAD